MRTARVQVASVTAARGSRAICARGPQRPSFSSDSIRMVAAPRLGYVIGVAMALSSIATDADAGTATSTLSVSATVQSTCSITSGSLTFGTYDTLSGSQVDGTATISVACTKGAATTITLGQGQNADTGSTDASPIRRMASGATMLAYSLYTDANRLTVWGNTVATGRAYVSASSATAQLTVYGRIAANQDVPAGSFSDTIVATISF